MLYSKVNYFVESFCLIVFCGLLLAEFWLSWFKRCIESYNILLNEHKKRFSTPSTPWKLDKSFDFERYTFDHVSKVKNLPYISFYYSKYIKSRQKLAVKIFIRIRYFWKIYRLNARIHSHDANLLFYSCAVFFR